MQRPVLPHPPLRHSCAHCANARPTYSFVTPKKIILQLCCFLGTLTKYIEAALELRTNRATSSVIISTPLVDLEPCVTLLEYYLNTCSSILLVEKIATSVSSDKVSIESKSAEACDEIGIQVNIDANTTEIVYVPSSSSVLHLRSTIASKIDVPQSVIRLRHKTLNVYLTNDSEVMGRANMILLIFHFVVMCKYDFFYISFYSRPSRLLGYLLAQ
jgi:hypothetical protein